MLYSAHSYKSASALRLYNLLGKTFSRKITQGIAYIHILPIFKKSLRYIYELHLNYYKIGWRLCWLDGWN